MANNDLALKAHLLRRAGFGASRFELEQISDKSYEEIVEDLIHPERFEEIDEDYLKRYNPEKIPNKIHETPSIEYLFLNDTLADNTRNNSDKPVIETIYIPDNLPAAAKTDNAKASRIRVK